MSFTPNRAITYIKDNFDKLNPHVKGDIHAVWVAKSDVAGAYQVDEEWFGVRLDGSLAYAYASGCSCWDGSYDAEVIGKPKEVKAFPFKHGKAPKEWLQAIAKFADDHWENNSTGEVDLT